MELVSKCAALGIFSALAVLLLRRYHPELSFLLSAAAVAVMLLSGAAAAKRMGEELQAVKETLGNSAELLQPVVKCLGISAVSRIGSGLCRDAAQAALASAVETVGVLCAMLVAMPTVLHMLRTIGGML